MKLSKTFRKVLFFWIIFHSIGYASYLFQITPSFSYEEDGWTHTHYILTPSCGEIGEIVEEDNFYPFHDFVVDGSNPTIFSGFSLNNGFVGVFGYYGTYEYLFYVILPLFTIFLVWIYRRFIA